MSSIKAMYQTAEEVHRSVIERATQDAEFRAALMADPKSAIRKEFDIHLPDSFEITVHESTGTSLHLALPQASEYLDEDQLEAVTGGTSPQCM